MNRLWVRIALGFAISIAVAICAVAVLTRQQVGSQVRTLVETQQVVDSGLVEQLSAYYGAHQSWQGVESVMGGTGQTGSSATTSPGGGMGHGSMGDHGSATGNGHGMGQGGSLLVLQDSAGQQVYVSPRAEHMGALALPSPDEAIPVVSNGQTVGYLYVLSQSGAPLTAPAQQFVSQVNDALVRGAIIAGLAGIALGLVIARGLAAPLRRLSLAARRIAQGDLGHRVPIGGPVELAELARDFNDMAGSLERSERLRQNMVADIAHELRTPVSVLQGNLRAILDDVYPLEKAEIATLYDETLMLSRLITDLHELALAEAGQLSLTLQPAELAPIVQRVTALFSELAAQNGVALRSTVPEALPPVLVDPDRTAQVIHNLLANALRHTPAGGQVEVVVTRHGAVVEVAVADSGAGIAPEDLPHVFERFWRADRARTRERGGSGLGLAIARAFVERQGGHIGVRSAPGQGTRFWFTLPLSARDGPARQQRAPDRGVAQASAS
jgi:signal transduction histidine kinase